VIELAKKKKKKENVHQRSNRWKNMAQTKANKRNKTGEIIKIKAKAFSN
jgi:hypothetical protein